MDNNDYSLYEQGAPSTEQNAPDPPPGMDPPPDPSPVMNPLPDPPPVMNPPPVREQPYPQKKNHLPGCYGRLVCCQYGEALILRGRKMYRNLLFCLVNLVQKCFG